jgi:hypothetical protein
MDGEGETQETPLLVIGIDGDLQRAERLQRPEHEPRLARILTDVARGEALDEVAHEELEVRFLVQDASAGVVGRDVVRLEDVLGVGLQAGRFRRVSVGWRRAGHDFERVSDDAQKDWNEYLFSIVLFINQAAKLVLIVFASHESGPDITKTVIPAAT